MGSTVAHWELFVVAVISAGVPVLIGWWRGKRKDKAESDSIIVGSAKDVVQILRQQQAENRQQIDNLRELVREQHNEIEELRAKLDRWEEKFRELGEHPPNGHGSVDHDDIYEVGGVPI